MHDIEVREVADSGVNFPHALLNQGGIVFDRHIEHAAVFGAVYFFLRRTFPRYY